VAEAGARIRSPLATCPFTHPALDRSRHAAVVNRARGVHWVHAMDATQVANGAGELLHRIADDVKTIARDEVELVGQELGRTVRRAANDAAIVVLGGIVALIGFGLLCVAAVVALSPVIGSLALRLVVMAVVYLAIGGAIAGSLAAKLKRDAVPNLSLAAEEARRTIDDVKRGLSR
jgi:hypothetical protein